MLCSALIMKAFHGATKRSWCNKGKNHREFRLEGKAGAPGSVRVSAHLLWAALGRVGHCQASPGQEMKEEITADRIGALLSIQKKLMRDGIKMERFC